MEKPTRETFEKYAKDHHWLQTEESPNPNGRQFNFITPTGNVVVAVFNLEGQLLTAIPLPPMIQQVRQVLPGAGPYLGKG
jgi:hypothetical protein